MSIFDADRWREVFDTLGANKLRTTLTAFGVLWGIFMLIIMLGAGSGLYNGVTSEFQGFATNSLYVWTQRTTMPYKGLPAGRWFSMNNEDTKAIRELVPEARVIAPRNEVGGWRGSANVTRGINTGAYGIKGDYPEVVEIQPFDIQEGRLMNEMDLDQKRKVAVIGAKVVNDLYEPGEEIIGSHIRINGVYFTVVGVIKTKKAGREAEDDAQSIFIPLSAFQQAFNYGNWVSYYGFMPIDGVSVAELQEKVLKVLKERHRVHPNDEFAFGTNNNEEEFAEYANVFTGINFLIWFVGTLTLVAGIIGISNIMLVIVKERTKEIGIRRAIGASPLSIVSQIILEALVLTSMAGYIGIVLGVWAVEYAGPMIEDESFKNPQIDFHTILIALGVLIISGCAAGFLPAYRALEIKPVEALRTEN
ncbi:MAG: ABC transporter permease [Flavobacteriales bacterium]|nr:ABC transporter permease [Flavobacteriales bacterium]MCB9203790.1 ABC transporter permease [Flavobacteriales bacterium]